MTAVRLNCRHFFVANFLAGDDRWVKRDALISGAGKVLHKIRCHEEDIQVKNVGHSHYSQQG
jgi:hypothetical protein